MAWTKEEAEAVAARQAEQLKANGVAGVTFNVVFVDAEHGWIVDGKYSVSDAARAA
jgi:hypothetical protein